MGNCLSAADRVDQILGIDGPKGVQGREAASVDLPPPAGKGTVPTETVSKGKAKHTQEEEEVDLDNPDTCGSNVITNPDTDLILNMLDPENGPAAGLPYQVHYLGPPRPPCEKERLATVMALGKIADNSAPDPEISTILKLVAGVFKAPAALCALFDEQRVFISEQEGNVIPCGEFPWRWTLCGWSMAFKNPQILVIPDTLKDVRFTRNEKVTVFPKVRFYCGAPLVASNGQRLGTLCFADVKPRKFDQASCILMNNMSELVVRQLEKDIALKLKEKDNKKLMETYNFLQRAVDCYEHAVALLDTSEKGWKIVYANSSWAKQTGLARENLVGSLLCDLLEGTDGTQLPSAKMLDAVKNAKATNINLARIKDPSVTRTVSLAFRPAGKTMLDDSTIPVGVPSFLDVNDKQEDVMHRFFFMTLEAPTNKRTSAASSAMSPTGMFPSLSAFSGSDNTTDSSVIAGLELAHLLGKGSFGWVYYGTWFGTPVAVKVIDEDVRKHTSAKNTPEEGPHMEALMAHELRHPNIVATLKYATHAIPQRRAPELHEYLQSHNEADIARILEDQQQPKALPAPQGTGSAGGHSDHSSTHGTPTQDNTPHEAALDAHQIGSVSRNSVEAQGKQQRAWAVIDVGGGHAAWEDGEEGHTSQGMMKGGQIKYDNSSMPENTLSGGVASSATDMPSTASSVVVQTWMVMEYCDRGCVQDAIDRGWMREGLDTLQSTANMEAVLATAHEIASALQYLHAHDIVHGDLSGWNVMLTSSGATGALGNRGFTAKVADFGLARSMDLQARITTRNYGTITHMPPELLTNGTMSKAVDVYSFGVLLWQMYTGSRPWSGLTHAQIILKVAQQRQQLRWDSSVPSDYKKLAQDCMAWDMDARPTFAQIVQRIDGMRHGEDL